MKGCASIDDAAYEYRTAERGKDAFPRETGRHGGISGNDWRAARRLQQFVSKLKLCVNLWEQPE